MIFRDRAEAGQILGSLLMRYAQDSGVVVLALPRGGVPVAYEVAKKLGLSMDVFVVRKLGVPGHEELAMGAVATGNVRHINRDVVSQFGIDMETIEAASLREQTEIERREQLYRCGRPPIDVRDKTVILIDDGLATGSTMRAAIAALRLRSPLRIVVAVPAAAFDTCNQIAHEVDEIVCVVTPEHFYAVGQCYQDFAQTTDDEVRELLSRAA